MARARKPPLPASRPPILKAALLVLACAIAGGVIVYKYSNTILTVARNAREKGLSRIAVPRSAAPTPRVANNIRPALPGLATPAPTAEPEAKPAAAAEGKLAKLSRPQLEREVQRLRDELEARQRENAEMKLQLKLLREGSRTRQ